MNMQKIKITDFYEEFRPYNEAETKEAILRVTKDERFFKAIKFFYPNYTKKDYNNLVGTLNSIKDFQINIMHNIIHKIVDNSSTGLTYSGIENVKPNKNYVFISNHRDIFLDASLLQIILVDENLPTTEITFGNNLMTDKLVYDIGKINKMFKVYRKGTPKELLKKTIQLSEYIRYTIFNKNQSVWIAQRGGRTKDGNDKTQTGIIKMLNSSGTSSIEENIKSLNILPLSISYEFEPNAYLKVNELLNTKNGKYIKSENEDLNSIIEGITANKGRIHLAFGNTINDDLGDVENISRTNDKVKKIAKLIDNQIYKNYKLWANNYIAADIVNENKKFTNYYSSKEKEIFLNYKKVQLSKVKGNLEQAEKLFLNIYANPVLNCIIQK